MRRNNPHQQKLRRGWRNNYRAGIPLPEMIFKDLFFALKTGWYYLRNGMTHQTVVTYPEFPSRNATLYKICSALRMNITNRAVSQFRLAVYWEDKTIRIPDDHIAALARKTHVLNFHSRNISKTNVEAAHQNAFGYALHVDPATFQGKCVRKSDENAAHDGAIITCPIAEREQGVVYHKLINNRCDEEYVEDIRVPVIGNTIPHVYLKYKPVDQRFANFRETPDDKLPQIHPPEEVLSGSEIKAIKEMARRMHLEFGEMDVLRDRDDGRVYVVDVNNTPTGPSHLKKKDMDIAINRLAQTFKREFLQ